MGAATWGWAKAGSRCGGPGLAGLPPFSPRPSGVQPSGRQLLQEVHPDSRRHVQRRALLSPLQGEGKGAGQEGIRGGV